MHDRLVLVVQATSLRPSYATTQTKVMVNHLTNLSMWKCERLANSLKRALARTSDEGASSRSEATRKFLQKNHAPIKCMAVRLILVASLVGLARLVVVCKSSVRRLKSLGQCSQLCQPLDLPLLGLTYQLLTGG